MTSNYSSVDATSAEQQTGVAWQGQRSMVKPRMSEQQRPFLHHVDLDHAMASLNHAEMIALAQMFEAWALTEENFSGEQRTSLIQLSSDYEAIAEFSGTEWQASAPDPATSLTFIGRWANRRQIER